MGCTTSNLNDLLAVALCRQRCAFLDETIRHSYALSAAHLSYINSLQSLALSLQQLDFTSPSSPPHSDDEDHHQLPPPHHSHPDQSHPQGLMSFPAAAYMKHHATPSQVYEQMPISPHAVHVGQYSSFPSHHYGDQTFGGGSSGYYSSAPPYGPELSAFASSSQAPPRIYSPWGFDSSYYSQHTTNLRYSKEIKEEERIPDLEDDAYEHGVVETVQGGQSADADDGAGDHSKFTEASLNQTVPTGSMENDGVEMEHELPADDAFEVASKIEVQFRRASASGTEITRILEEGTLPYYPKHGAYQAFSKVLKLFALPLSLMVSQLSISKVYKIGHRSLELNGDLLTRSRNLPSTLQKLHLWEKKLYKEVKAEEKIRVLHDQKCRMLKRLEDRGADFHKVDTTQTSIKNLSTKIRMGIQVVELISVKINKIRDEELWPQVNELIQGLTKMWESMHECHRIQCEAIREAGVVGWMGCRNKQLEQELINWSLQFCSWISAQKRYVRALNNWLMKCLMHEPDSYSPGRMGAPRVFVICNRWSQAMERICEKEVLERGYVFSRRVLQIWEQERLEIMLDRDVERNVERDDEEQKLVKQIRAVKKKMEAAFGDVNDDDDEGDGDGSTGLEGSLQQILEAMERFAGMSATLYQELLQTGDQEERGSVEHMHAC